MVSSLVLASSSRDSRRDRELGRDQHGTAGHVAASPRCAEKLFLTDLVPLRDQGGAG